MEDTDSIQRITQNVHTHTIPCTEYALQNGRVTRKSLSMINPYVTQPLWLRGGQHSVKQKLLHRTSQQISAVRRMIRSPQLCLKFHKYIWRSAPLYFLRDWQSQVQKSNVLFKKIHYLSFVTWEDQQHSIIFKKEKQKQNQKPHKSLSNKVKCY